LTLDGYRYIDAPASFGADEGGKEMGLEDVKLLVEWKLYVHPVKTRLW
jgi:hypothetical protein